MNRNGSQALTIRIQGSYSPEAAVILHEGDRLELLSQIPTGDARLVVTSPPYNIGKRCEKRLAFEHYLDEQRATLRES